MGVGPKKVGVVFILTALKPPTRPEDIGNYRDPEQFLGFSLLVLGFYLISFLASRETARFSGRQRSERREVFLLF